MRVKQPYSFGWLTFFLLAGALWAWMWSAGAQPAAASPDWYDPARHFRVSITIDANNHDRHDAVAEIDLDLDKVLNELDYDYPLLDSSLKVVELDRARNVIDENVVFQYDAAANGAGTLSLLIAGQTPGSAVRRYDVYFDIGGVFEAPAFPDHVVLGNAVDEGFPSYRLDGVNSTLFFHTQGAGFSSLVDGDGTDWIAWNKAKGDAGDFRGIPNLVHPADGGFFHPGRKTANSTISADGPLKVTILSASNNGAWRARWDVFPTYARMTILAKPTTARYWFQYEGTPGGGLTDADRVYRSDGREVRGLGQLVRDIASPSEWMYIADAADGPDGRSLFLINHRDDTIVDSYRPLGSMTIMAFGRDGANGRFFTDAGEQFSFGLVDSADASAVVPVIEAIATPLKSSVGKAEVNGTPNPPARPLTFRPTHDSYVDSARPTRSYGSAAALRVRNAAADMVTYLKFDVTGLAAPPVSATLRLYVTDPGPDGGALFLVDNSYLNTTTAWVESGLNWRNAPLTDGDPIAAAKPAVKSQWLEFDVTSVVDADGIYSFALAGTSKDLVAYMSSESSRPPELVVIPAD